ncbi:aldo/keto reductase [Humibacter ginsenosidimutans]|uniref:Aldo/keto reductase n=1 Tax=Humibacter ginsenosidimutans TaxID=2599293 RepID=A0A5B8M0D5_9MICO|nr:aldo/keto reductase [Humibacter ginsenosidimutans]QDZ13469.1 aldo/keto reductase [Humibacter ginsenosidimutans]
MEIPQRALNDGTSIPALGFGTYPLKGDEGERAVASAIEAGYRLLDTAVNYANEDAVGRGMRASGLDRAQLVVQTKLPGRHHGYDETLASFEASRRALGIDTIDVYLIHWPNPSVDRYLDSFKAMIDLRDRGLVRSIGVSNFTEEFLLRLQRETGELPAVNQVELHPYFPQEKLRAFHDEHGIVTEAWSPLGKNSPVLSEQAVTAAAAAHGVTPAQVVLRWHVQLGSVPLPKSATPQRQRENLDVFGFALSDDEVAAITALGRASGRLFDGDPNHHEEQ